MSKFSTSQLKNAKKQVRNFKIQQKIEEKENLVVEKIVPQKSLEELAKELNIDLNNPKVSSLLSKGFKITDIKPEMLEETIISKQSKLKISQNLKDAIYASNKVDIKFSFEVGDLVEISDRRNNKEKIGIILEIKKSENPMLSIAEAMYSCEALILSTAGKHWIQAKLIKKI